MPNYSQTQALIEHNRKGDFEITSDSSSFQGVLTEYGNSIFHRTRIDFTGTMALSNAGTTGSATACVGTLALGSFPFGVLGLGGGNGSLTITAAGAGSTNISAGSAAVLSLGAAAAASTSATLLTTTANILSSQAMTMTDSTKSSLVADAGTMSWVDKTTTTSGGTQGQAILNVKIPVADCTAGGATVLIAVEGFVNFPWINAGDV